MESIMALRVLSEYPNRISALEVLMRAPALFSGVAVSLRGDLIQLLLEPGQRQLAVTMLGPFFRGRGLDSRREMSYAHRGFRSIDILAARSAGAHRLPSNFFHAKASVVDRL